MKSEQFSEEQQELNGVSIRITTYKIGDEFHCHVLNADPGATIARAMASTKDGARQEAMRKASERIKQKRWPGY